MWYRRRFRIDDSNETTSILPDGEIRNMRKETVFILPGGEVWRIPRGKIFTLPNGEYLELQKKNTNNSTEKGCTKRSKILQKISAAKPINNQQSAINNQSMD